MHNYIELRFIEGLVQRNAKSLRSLHVRPVEAIQENIFLSHQHMLAIWPVWQSKEERDLIGSDIRAHSREDGMLFINHGGLVSSPKAKKGNRELHIGAWTPSAEYLHNRHMSGL